MIWVMAKFRKNDLKSKIHSPINKELLDRISAQISKFELPIGHSIVSRFTPLGIKVYPFYSRKMGGRVKSSSIIN